METVKILVLHGPNLNFVGIREPEKYGTVCLDDINRLLNEVACFRRIDSLEIRQTNHEGILIDWIQDAYNWAGGILINPGGLAHTSVILRDAIASVSGRVLTLEVHMTDIHKRETFRHVSLLSGACVDTISGFGVESYTRGLHKLIDVIEKKNTTKV